MRSRSMPSSAETHPVSWMQHQLGIARAWGHRPKQSKDDGICACLPLRDGIGAQLWGPLLLRLLPTLICAMPVKTASCFLRRSALTYLKFLLGP